MKTVQNRWVLITGAAHRIGRAIALEMARAGWDIILHYNSSSDEAIRTAKKIEDLGRKVCLAELNLADLPLVKRLIPAMSTELGPIAVLINNASIFVPDTAEPNFAVHMTINAEAPCILSEAFRKQAPKNHSGAIINILDADPTGQEFSFYNTSKKTLAAMTLDMAESFAPHVRVNGVALGTILKGPRQSEKHFQKLVQKTPLGKAITPEDVATCVRFLIDNAGITGAILPVDGGLHLKNEKR